MTVKNHESPQVAPSNFRTGPSGHNNRGKLEFFRYGVVLPLAAIMTAGLTLTMATLVATEFQPQDKSETANFEINPVVEDIPEPVKSAKLDPIEKVIIPPPPEPLDIKKATIERPAPVELPGRKVEFDPTTIDFGGGPDLGLIDKDPTPLVRIPPTFPTRFLQGDMSGYCRVRFDVSPEGQPYNVMTTLCTSVQLEKPTVKSVRRWKYAAQTRNGRPVARSGLETVVRFDLKDERGEVLPLPEGY